MISRLAALDFSKKVAPMGIDNELDALSSGLNMLAEELNYSVVSKNELEREKAFSKKVLSIAPIVIFVLDSKIPHYTYFSPNIRVVYKL